VLRMSLSIAAAVASPLASSVALTDDAFELFKRDIAARVIQVHWRRWVAWKAKVREQICSASLVACWGVVRSMQPKDCSECRDMWLTQPSYECLCVCRCGATQSSASCNSSSLTTPPASA
jgi:hypothetical protein